MKVSSATTVALLLWNSGSIASLKTPALLRAMAMHTKAKGIEDSPPGAMHQRSPQPQKF